ncbi:MAG: YbdK family carboxylate-amine ligase [Candidatus Eremiobacteraeota bacterium]|nr:YbdK family carboxylate-amine ligase [Candidatus Eremiobacteraeota bacterium]
MLQLATQNEDFHPSEFLTLGVEVEVQLLDQRTLDLAPVSPRLLAALGDSSAFKPEFYSTMLEMVTGVCKTVDEAERELGESSSRLLEVAQRSNIGIAGVGTHPFAGLGQEAHLYPDRRYRRLLKKNQWIGKNKNLFGLHIHLGMTSGQQAIELLNAARPYLAYLLAFSASSPFWHGQDSGLASARATVFESQPISGPAPLMRDWSDYLDLTRRMLRSGAIGSLKDLHWDIRPCPHFGTLELRICDGQANLSDTMALVAVVQSLFSYLEEQRQSGLLPATASEWALRENKWRAIRWGLEAEVITDEHGTVACLGHELHDLFHKLESHAQRLGCAHHLHRAHLTLERGNSTQRQRQVYRRNRSLKAVIHHLMEEYRYSLEPVALAI